MKYKKNTIETYLETVNKSSYKTYKSLIKRYFRLMNLDPDQYIPIDVRKLGNGDKVDLEDRIIKDLKTYAKMIKKEPKKSQKSYISSFKKYLESHYIDLPSIEWNNIKNSNNLKRVRSTIPKETPTTEDLKFILQNASLKAKALVSVATSTGLRVDECVSIKLSDIDMKNRSIISLRKGNYYGISFFTEETKDLLNAWLLEREKYIKTKKRKSKFAREGKYNEKDYLFPFLEGNAEDVWNNLTERAGAPYNEVTISGRNKYHHYNFHSLRRFYEQKLYSTKIDKKIYDAISGHISNLDNDYIEIRTHHQDNVDKWKKEYDTYSDCLAVHSDYKKAKSEFGNKFSYQDKMINRLQEDKELLKLELNMFKKKYESDIKSLKHEQDIELDHEKHTSFENQYHVEQSNKKELDELKAQLQELTKQVKIMSKE